MDTKTIALQMVRTVAASPERVFEVWTSSEQLERWTCPDPNAHVEVDIDLRVGGRYSISMEVEGGTEIRLAHEGFSASSDRDGHETSWKMCTAKLADLVAPR